uniref:3'(2'),5'-bisphosphate nucleotidase 1 n=1 Tax=Romanomermis culicivorax TaxID=13658 RepID=A0A915JAN8_ROMCU
MFFKFQSANDLQTVADRRAQLCIVGSLKKRFGPDLTVIGEEDEEDLPELDQSFIEEGFDLEVLDQCHVKFPESLTSLREKDIVVWVDPLDGTSEFTQGLLDHVTVLIGIAVGGRATAGVIHQPFYGYNDKSVDPNRWGRTIWAINGLGAFGFLPKLPPKSERIITTTRSHSNKYIISTIDAMNPDKVLRVGGAGHKVILLMEGKAHAYVFASKGCKKWDTCAPEAVLSTLGGTLTDLHGNRLQYTCNVEKPNNRGVLATAPTVDHQWYVDRIPENVKSSF